MKPNWDDIKDAKERKNKEWRLARRAHDTKHCMTIRNSAAAFTWPVQSKSNAAAT